MRKTKQVFVYILVLVVVLFVESIVESSLVETRRQYENAEVTQELSTISGKLQGVITNNLSLISGLAAHIAINPQIDQQGFERYASAVMREESLIINMAGAPDMVVTMVYPLEPNKRVIGLDYSRNTEQVYAAKLTKNRKGMVVAGPVKLVQGGSAFIGRSAIYDDKGDFWGIVSCPIDEQLLYKEAGLLDQNMEIDVAIRGKDGKGELGAVFYGDETLFDDSRLARVSIDVGQGHWVLVARAKTMATQSLDDVRFLRIASLTLVVLSFTFIYYRGLSTQKELGYKEMLVNKASYDQLTGLCNRFLFIDLLGKAIAHASRTNTKMAVLFIDLDGFKPVNDHYGHDSGDVVLREVGDRITASVRSCDTVARYSGDEFVVIVEDIIDSSSVVKIAAEIIETINKPFSIKDSSIYCGSSIGISVYPEDGSDIESLLAKADQAMYEVKRSGKNGWHFFTESMQIRSEKRHHLYNRMVQAVKDEKLAVYYQPIVDLSNSDIVKCEALVRWFDQGELIPTVDFISLAEETGKINEIDRFVLVASTEYLLQLAKTTGQKVGLSINLSPRVFSSKDDSLQLWLSLVIAASKELDITVEITERLLTKDTDKVLEVLNTLKSYGVTIAIDDFGTGYSSLSYLTKFPIDILKIDQSFIANLGQNARSSTLVEAVISLSHKLSLLVVAEGVESAEQIELLKGWDCHFAQGYYFFKPMPAEDFSKLMTQKMS